MQSASSWLLGPHLYSKLENRESDSTTCVLLFPSADTTVGANLDPLKWFRESRNRFSSCPPLTFLPKEPHALSVRDLLGESRLDADPYAFRICDTEVACFERDLNSALFWPISKLKRSSFSCSCFCNASTRLLKSTFSSILNRSLSLRDPSSPKSFDFFDWTFWISSKFASLIQKVSFAVRSS